VAAKPHFPWVFSRFRWVQGDCVWTTASTCPRADPCAAKLEGADELAPNRTVGKKPTLGRPCCLKGAGAPSFLSSSQSEGAERRQARPFIHALRRRVRTLRSVRLACRRSTAAFPWSRSAMFNSGPGFLGRGDFAPVPVQRAPRRATVLPPDTMPGAARVRGYEPRPQGPHPAPSSRRLMMTPSMSEAGV
jgi:hypothetical protein